MGIVPQQHCPLHFLILASYHEQYVKREDVILMAGCGNSRLTEDMFEDGKLLLK